MHSFVTVSDLAPYEDLAGSAVRLSYVQSMEHVTTTFRRTELSTYLLAFLQSLHSKHT